MSTFIPVKDMFFINFSQILALDDSLRLNGPTTSVGDENAEPGLPLETTADARGSRLTFHLN